jgi:hypothetical protein
VLCLIRTGNIKLIRPVGSTPRYKGKSIPKFGLPSDLDPPPEIIVKEKETPTAWDDSKPKPKSTKSKKPMNTVQKSFSRNSRDHSEIKEVGPSRAATTPGLYIFGNSIKTDGFELQIIALDLDTRAKKLKMLSPPKLQSLGRRNTRSLCTAC